MDSKLEIEWVELRGNGSKELPSSLSVGIDEAGRGPLAGPVAAAAVILPNCFANILVKDSKKLSEAKRDLAYQIILEEALAYCIVFVGHLGIDRLNIREASRQAMAAAALKLSQNLAFSGSAPRLHFMVDGNTPMPASFFQEGFTQETIIKGDALVPAISAASILAKVSRDRFMVKLDTQYPGYDFALHKGYPTKLHKERIRSLGPCPIHRRTFSGVKEFLA